MVQQVFPGGLAEHVVQLRNRFGDKKKVRPRGRDTMKRQSGQSSLSLDTKDQHLGSIFGDVENG